MLKKDSPQTHIALFRLVTGEDIITEFSLNKPHAFYTWYHPLKLIFQRTDMGAVGVLLIPWLPEEIIHPNINTQCSMALRDIMSIIPIRESMKIFYKAVRKTLEEKITKSEQTLEKHLQDMSAAYLVDEARGPMGRILENWEEYFNDMDDTHEGIIYN